LGFLHFSSHSIETTSASISRPIEKCGGCSTFCILILPLNLSKWYRLHWPTMSRMNKIRPLLLLVFLLGDPPQARQQGHIPSRPIQVAVVSIGSGGLLGNYDGADIVDFAFSPDDTKIAIVFEVGELDQKLGARLGVWQVSNKKLLGTVRLPGAMPPSLKFGSTGTSNHPIHPGWSAHCSSSRRRVLRF
jgi:hypothetical protein